MIGSHVRIRCGLCLEGGQRHSSIAVHDKSDRSRNVLLNIRSHRLNTISSGDVNDAGQARSVLFLIGQDKPLVLFTGTCVCTTCAVHRGSALDVSHAPLLS